MTPGVARYEPVVLESGGVARYFMGGVGSKSSAEAGPIWSRPAPDTLNHKRGNSIDFTMKAATEKPIMDLIFRLFVCVGNAQKWNAVCNNDSF